MSKTIHINQFINSNIKGFLFVGLIVFISFYLANIEAIYKTTHLAATAFAILLGAFLSPIFFRFEHTLNAGVNFSAKKLLRLGIVLYGFNVTFTELYSIGIYGIIISIIIICSVFFIAILAGVKIFGLDKETSILIGAGSAICGAAAVLAVESSLKSEPFKGIIAVGTVVVFGLLGMFLYPLAYYYGLIPNLDTNSVGIFMGATLHEVANVVGAAEMAKDLSQGEFTQNAANMAIILKMMRVIMLVPFLLLLTYFIAHDKNEKEIVGKKKIAIPYFAFGFLGVIILNTFLSDYKDSILLGISVESLLSFGKLLCSICIVFAMAALGLQINIKKFLGSGKSAFALAFLLWIVLIVGGYLLTLAFRDFI